MFASGSPRPNTTPALGPLGARGMSRGPLLAVGGVALLAGIWVGLRRAGWSVPVPVGAPADHGVLMVSGFLGTLISLERAAAVRLPWSLLAPAASALGTVTLLVGLPHAYAAGLFVVAGGVLCLVYARVLQLQLAAFTVTMAAGGVSWVVGTLAWAAALPTFTWLSCWAAFLVLTIVGERLELSRLTRLSGAAWRTFTAIGLFHGVAIAASLFSPSLGVRLSGLAFAAWAGWLLRFDVARWTVRTPGLPRFTALALLWGYGWLLVAGVLWTVSPLIPAGLRYDAEVHSLFLGFVFSMIFAHAPIIVPSLLGGEVHFHRRFYVHLALLHLSGLLRVATDLGGGEAGRRWAVVLNTLAILLFLANTVRGLRRPSSPAPARSFPRDHTPAQNGQASSHGASAQRQAPEGSLPRLQHP